MEQSTAPTAVVAQPKTIVIERRWAIVGGALIAALDHRARHRARVCCGRRSRPGRPAGLPALVGGRAGLRARVPRPARSRCLRACRCRRRRTGAIRRVAAPTAYPPSGRRRAGPARNQGEHAGAQLTGRNAAARTTGAKSAAPGRDSGAALAQLPVARAGSPAAARVGPASAAASSAPRSPPRRPPSARG